MGNARNPDRLQQLVADALTIERQIEEAFIQWLVEVQGHTEAAEAIRRFQTMVKGQRETLEACLQRIGGSEIGSESSVVPFDMTAVGHKTGPHPVSKA